MQHFIMYTYNAYRVSYFVNYLRTKQMVCRHKFTSLIFIVIQDKLESLIHTKLCNLHNLVTLYNI